MGYDCKTDIAMLPDLRVIDEDDTHIVVAVRIEKARLTQNIAFIAALADCLVPVRSAAPNSG